MTRPARARGALARTTGTSAAALVAALALAIALALAGAVPAAHADPADEAAPPAHAYQAAGPEVSGAVSQAQAPLLLPGIHLDTFALGGQSEDESTGTAKYYRIAVSSGQRVHASATVAAPPYADGIPEDADQLSLAVTFLTAGGDDCEDSGKDGIGQSRTGDGPITSSAVSGAVGWDGCPGEELFLRVTRTGTRAGDSPLPVEIQVAIEPAGAGGGSPAVTEEIEDSGAGPVPPAQDEPFEAGRSFATAPEAAPGSYVMELVPGEVGVVRIDVQEGQRLRWRVETTSQPEGAGELALRTFNAVREQVSVHGGSWVMRPQDRVAGGGMTAPVDRGNRGSELTSVATAWLPGTHYVTLQRLQRPADAEPAGAAPVTVVLTLEVDGEVAEDAPEGSVLELGETTVTSGPLSFAGIDASWGRLAMFGGAGLLTLLGLLTGIAGMLVLRMRRS
ncbi:hypothetical protein CFK39_13795 [Brachybacterium avium]|uniref:Peptidase n=1 Tax=Brachybacterium avium TaxID=2017485 RepID=A0A220UG55_9MICO|nr:hypothetical protein [Brachybacterium avium]ASK66703.1 hypothetical protein CFK39_13795 [Brachybacterium avium]